MYPSAQYTVRWKTLWDFSRARDMGMRTHADQRMTAALAGSYSTMYPATALAATVSGDARYICPGPLRPGKFRFWALITTWSGRVDTPGPALMHAPQLGPITCAPDFWKMSV